MNSAHNGKQIGSTIALRGTIS